MSHETQRDPSPEALEVPMPLIRRLARLVGAVLLASAALGIAPRAAGSGRVKLLAGADRRHGHPDARRALLLAPRASWFEWTISPAAAEHARCSSGRHRARGGRPP